MNKVWKLSRADRKWFYLAFLGTLVTACGYPVVGVFIGEQIYTLVYKSGDNLKNDA